MQPIISIVVPVYNMQSTLSRCLDSILVQTYKYFELILVDDGSTDDSLAICQRYYDTDPRIIVLHKENGGLSSARNAGLDIAQGKYIIFIDSDDYVDPDLLEIVVSPMENQGYDCCCFGMIKEFPDENTTERIGFIPRSFNINSEQERMDFLLYVLLNYRIGWEAWSRIFRMDIIRQHHLHFVSEREVYAEDLLFSFSYWLYASSCTVLNACPYHYVQHSGSLMDQNRKRNVLPQTNLLVNEALHAVKQTELPIIQQDFAAIHLQILEWQTRPYIGTHGIDWVYQQLTELIGDVYTTENFTDILKHYGQRMGVVTVVLVVSCPEDIPQAQHCLKSVLDQTLQKLDVLVLGLPLNTSDFRVRHIPTQSLSPEAVIQTAFRESLGEYIYFADIAHIPEPDLLERCSDALKYNDCCTLLLTKEPNCFFNIKDPVSRRDVRNKLRSGIFLPYRAMLRSNLLWESGLSVFKEIRPYMADVLLSGHILMLQEVLQPNE